MKDTFMAPKAASAQKTGIHISHLFLLSVLGVYLLFFFFFINPSAHNMPRRISSRAKDPDINGGHDQYGPTATRVKPFSGRPTSSARP